ncbi:MAG: hypothetical protein JRG97_11955 [Deltaproteobacteria bacterium]|nr:hypothetical protein [Deltaproteobacteria bacterium]MBW2005884.1 hypothetical protein [Deltaproteobacteria bacterium]MBW2141762.1 hypothetical protein [Deltaproteobacteria bacterium]
MSLNFRKHFLPILTSFTICAIIYVLALTELDTPNKIQLSILIGFIATFVIYACQLHILKEDVDLRQRPWIGPCKDVAKIDITSKNINIRTQAQNYGLLPAINLVVEYTVRINGKKIYIPDPGQKECFSTLFPTNLLLAEFRITPDQVVRDHSNPKPEVGIEHHIEYEGLKGEKYESKYTISIFPHHNYTTIKGSVVIK